MKIIKKKKKPAPTKNPGVIEKAILKDEKCDTRNTAGQFATGHKGGPGNPQYGMIAIYRRVINEAVSTDDLRAVVKTLIAIAKDKKHPHCVAAAKVVLDRAVGAVKQEVTIEAAARKVVVEQIITPEEAAAQVQEYNEGSIESQV